MHIEKKGYEKSKFFNINKYNGFDGAYDDAVKYRDTYFEGLGNIFSRHETSRSYPIDFKLTQLHLSYLKWHRDNLFQK